MGVIKHEPRKPRAKKPTKTNMEQPVKVVVSGPASDYSRTASMQHDINHIGGLGDVEISLDEIARALYRLTGEDHAVSIYTGRNGYPVKLALTDTDGNDVMDRLVEAIERIADSVAKLAGLSRPRLESWHEQDAYQPRYKDVAVDGGAPGPKNSKG
jgi:hypothetical protein